MHFIGTDIRKSALVVMDMQRFYLDSLNRDTAQGLSRDIDAFSEAWAARGGSRILVATYKDRETPLLRSFDDDKPTSWHMMAGVVCKPFKSDIGIFKKGYSAAGNPAFEDTLQIMGVKNVIIVGVYTDDAIRATARDLKKADIGCIAPLDLMACDRRPNSWAGHADYKSDQFLRENYIMLENAVIPTLSDKITFSDDGRIKLQTYSL